MFAHDLCRAVAIAQGRSCLLVAGRLELRDVGVRILSAEARVSHGNLRNGDLGEQNESRLSDAEQTIRSSRLVILEAPEYVLDLTELAYQAWLEHDIDLVVVDDADLLGLGEFDQRTSLATLRQLAEQLQLPVVATGTTKRKVLSPEPPTDWERWGPAGEEGVGVSIAIHRPDLYPGLSSRPGEADFLIQRSGGDPATVNLSFQGHYSRFVNMARASA